MDVTSGNLEKALGEVAARQPELLEDARNNPDSGTGPLAAAVTKQLDDPRKDPLVWHIAVGALAALALLAGVGALVLALVSKDVPESLVAIGSASVGALVGIFATPPSSK